MRDRAIEVQDLRFELRRDLDGAADIDVAALELNVEAAAVAVASGVAAENDECLALALHVALLDAGE